MFAIKFRKEGSKSWLFVTPDGYGNRLRIHAIQYDRKEEAKIAAEWNQRHNAGVEFKVVKL